MHPPTVLRVNQVRRELPPAAGRANLLQVLRNDLQLNGPKFGCGLGAARACVIPARGVAGREITTLEGLSPLHGVVGELHPVQQAFVDAQAAQCGYCLNGMVMMAAALLAREPNPSEADVRRELSGNLCRCGTHIEIVQAVLLAAKRMQESRA
jgi:nicotinate dehydrogenase subunit A